MNCNVKRLNGNDSSVAFHMLYEFNPFQLLRLTDAVLPLYVNNFQLKIWKLKCRFAVCGSKSISNQTSLRLVGVMTRALNFIPIKKIKVTLTL